MASPRRGGNHPGCCSKGRKPPWQLEEAALGLCAINEVLLILTIFSDQFLQVIVIFKQSFKSTAAALVDATQAAVLVLYFCVLWESC